MEIKNLHRHLKRATYKYESRPILKCVHYGSDGSIAVTDSHRMLLVKDFHNHKEEFNQDLSTMEIKDEKYPDIANLIPKEFTSEVVISLSVLIRIMKALGTSTDEFVNWELSENEITFINHSDAQFYGSPVKISTKAKVEGKKIKIAFSARYVKECCEFLMDAKERYAVDDVTIKLQSPTKPAIFFIDETKHIYLVTPVRTN